jgi:hypothetical protein
MLGHFTALILMHAADMTKRTWHNNHGTIAGDHVYMRVDILTHDISFAANGAVDGKFGTHEHMVPNQLSSDYLDLAVFALF